MAASFAIGMDLGGTNARAAVVDDQGRILQVAKEPLSSRTPDGAADALAACVATAMAGRSREDCAGAGVGLAGQIDRQTDRVLVAPNLGWRDLDFATILSGKIGMPVHVGNDLAVAGLGEARVGAARGFKDAVLIFVGTGIGSALVLDGELYRGHRGIAGELGHTKVRPGGRLCGCGERGCLEAYAGGLSMGERVRESMDAGRPSSLSAKAPAGLRPSGSMIDEAAAEGDALALEIRDDAANLIGVAAANLITELNPGILILGGGVLLGAPAFREKIEGIIRANAGRAALAQCAIVEPVLGDDAGVIGASFLGRG